VCVCVCVCVCVFVFVCFMLNVGALNGILGLALSAFLSICSNSLRPSSLPRSDLTSNQLKGIPNKAFAGVSLKEL
jgi:hypothetical protein